MSTIDLKEVFLAFREQCIWTRTCFNMYFELYESEPEVQDLMRNSAPVFFHDLNEILIDYCLIQISKHLDPKQTCGKTNLTIDYIDSEVEASRAMTQEIKQLSTALSGYKILIKDARNKILSHTDRDAVLSNQQFAAHTKEDVLGFFENLQQYCDAVGEAVGVGPLDFRATPAPGDVLDLLQCLKRA
jgi:hypothetical protein